MAQAQGVQSIQGNKKQQNKNQSFGLAQKKEILAYLQNGYWITPMDALRLFGCFRLGARIWDLKKEGHLILTKTIELNGKRFASYGL